MSNDREWGAGGTENEGGRGVLVSHTHGKAKAA